MAQEVILISDVPGLGQLGDHRKVKDGFARNYLIPQRLAVIANSNSIKRFEKQKEKLSADRNRQLAQSKTLAEKISKVGLVFERPVGQGGRLFGSVTPADIVTELAKQQTTVEKKSVLMNGPIKTAGDHVVRVRIHSQITIDVPVKVVGKEVKKDRSQTDEPDEQNTEHTELVQETAE